METRPFSLLELRDIAASLAVLAAVFSYPEFLSRPLALAVSLFVLGVGFLGHELSHKFVARRSGFFAEYRMWPQGLLLALLLAVATGGAFTFAAPGAVVFGSALAAAHPHRSDVGKIGLAGPVFNIVLLFLFAAAFATVAPSPVLLFAAAVNGWLALFNLIPFPPLDGEKVFRWDRRIWLAAFGAAAAGFVLVSLAL